VLLHLVCSISNTASIVKLAAALTGDVDSGTLLTELIEHHFQSGEQFLRRPEACAATRAHMLDTSRECPGLRARLAAELHHEGFPHW
jgi:hypothetical protein